MLYYAFTLHSMYLIASPTVEMFSPASSSEISMSNAFSKSITSSTISKESAPRSLTKLADARAIANAPIIVSRPVVEMPKINIEAVLEKFPDAVPVHSPVKGKMLWGIDVDDVSSAPTVGTTVTASEPVGFIQTYYGMEDVVPLADGRIAMICVKQGENVVKGEIIAFIQR